MVSVQVAKAFNKFYWISVIIFCVLTVGVGLFIVPILIWRKMAVINRTKITFEKGANVVIFFKGRWFVRDDDTIPTKAIDNIKIDRSIMGKMFGWCDIEIETRSEKYNIYCVSTKQAEKFKSTFLAE